jgi:predicted NAD/FAD-dependent oxidoreductase
MWAAARTIDPRLFELDRADVVQLIRWQHAVPAVGPGYHRRLRQFRQRPPIVFAGDWLVQPCVEGAVRSGEAAATMFGSAS